MPRSSSRRSRRRRARNRLDNGSPARGRGWLASTFKWLAIFAVVGCLLVAIGLGYLWAKISPELPDVEQLREVQLQIPLRIFTADGDLIAEYGEQRREPIMISEVPDNLTNAIIATEDQHFYSHPGVAWQGLARAALHLVRTGRKGPGGSTITMQVARNFFLSNERTYDRKLREIFLSFKIESELEKDEILELYLNKIYLGQRSYGFAAASKVYYGKKIGELELAEAAMLAGLPKAPSSLNPIASPERAIDRRNYVLRRMQEVGFIDADTLRDTQALPVSATLHYSRPAAEANYVGEMARARVQQLFGDIWSTGGYNVYTTIRSADQRAANSALRGALYDYEARHGYLGPIATLSEDVLADPEALLGALDDLPRPADLTPAVVLEVAPESASLVARDGGEYALALADVEWARERIDVETRGDEITAVDQVLAVGDVVHLQISDEGVARFVQEPGVEGAFVAVDPVNGEIIALVGGYDYYRSKFNRVTQARRQPGSTFKPFIYAAALDAGDTAATIYNDAPVVFHDDALEGEWRPQNYSGRFFGPTRLREALVKSRNLVSVRVLREIGIPYAVEYAQRFGFAEEHLPPDLSLSLGSAAVTPMELASAFGVFANGGYKVQPHYIDRIIGPRGEEVYRSPEVALCDDCNIAEEQANPLVAEMEAETAAEDRLVADSEVEEGELSPEAEERLDEARIDVISAPRVIDARNAWIMTSMMRDVVTRGTARRAGEALGRTDLAGKTGTTNNQLDAWFAGYNNTVVASAWVGSDGLDPLGRGESGGIAALPIWTTFMAETVVGTPEAGLETLPGMTAVRIDRRTGEPSAGDGTIIEYFFDETVPEGVDLVRRTGDQTGSGTGQARAVTAAPRTSIREQQREVDQLF
jgi:penicillin-binding protein 1A